MDPAPHAELTRYIAMSAGLPAETAARVVADVVAYFSETTEQFVRRRHAELRRRGRKNPQIWPEIARELAGRPVAPVPPTERQLRRIVYG
ncbi:hypothetical protein SAMN05421504_104447 [Amycolatopsis xylanica]|uniref:Uncharacterized protein n=1 Tax=Amycolatopsis xylanica TaxID=589385 RepID=A0A1H3GYH6_9PSEU|nr:hypothetical protein [Amycolatopsis xylanica]SDY08332.1 hypothetical protein SAMN05421504_104447 [Amycolatopsis xylanica]